MTTQRVRDGMGPRVSSSEHHLIYDVQMTRSITAEAIYAPTSYWCIFRATLW